jgi:hypothetical protein
VAGVRDRPARRQRHLGADPPLLGAHTRWAGVIPRPPPIIRTV